MASHSNVLAPGPLVYSVGEIEDGDIVTWSKKTWTLSGSVENASEKPWPHNLYKMAGGFKSWDDCMSLCPKIQAGGRLPLTREITDAKQLSLQYYNPGSKDLFWTPFKYQTDGNFSDYYTADPPPPEL